MLYHKIITKMEVDILNFNLENSNPNSEDGQDKKPKEPNYGSGYACFYNCMAYFAEKFGWKCKPETFAQDYYDGSLYNSKYSDGKWQGTGCKKERDIGPNAGEELRPNEWYPNHVAYDYMSSYFNTESNHWSQNDDIKDLMNTSTSGYVMGVISVGSNDRDNKHTVILQSLSSDGEYSYYDPSNGKYGKCTQSDIRYAGKVTGLRKDSEEQ